MAEALLSPRKTLDCLASLRKKTRKLFLADGLVSISLGIAAAAAASFTLDYLLVLPFSVRLVLLGGGFFALAHFARRKVADPLAHPLPDEDLANLVERSNPELRQSLITAVELTKPGSESAIYVSSSMLDSVVKELEDRISGISFDGIFELDRYRRKSLILCAAGAGLLTSAFFCPVLFATWVKRDLFLGKSEWPKTTQLEVVAPQFPAVVAMGDSLEVVARTVKGSPKSVTIYSWEEGGALRSDMVNETAQKSFHKVFENISRPFSLRIKGGDYETADFEVDVRLRPRIDMQSVQIWCEYPAYTGLESTPRDRPLAHGNLKVPTGTKVAYRMGTNVPVKGAFFLFRSARDSAAAPPPVKGPQEAAPPPIESWPGAGAVELAVSGGTTFQGEFTVKDNGQYYFQLESSDGFRSQKPERFRVEAVPDRKPIVKIIEPERITEEVSADAVVQVKVTANDDYGIQKGSLEGSYFLPGKDKGQSQTIDLPGLSAGPDISGAQGPKGRRGDVEAEMSLRVRDLSTGESKPPAVGGRFQFVALAADFAGNIGETLPHYLQIVDKDDLLRILTDQLMIAKDLLKEIERRQRSASKDVDELQGQLSAKGSISDGDAQKLSRHRQDQQRISEALEREALDLSHILNRTEANNVGDDKWKTWVTGVRDDLSEIAKTKSPAVVKQIDDLAKAASQSPQDVSRLGVISNAQRDVDRDIVSLISRLTEFGDMNAAIQILREVRKRQSDLRDKTRSLVPGASPEEPQK